MTDRSYNEIADIPYYGVVFARSLELSSGNSPRINGKLVFRQNTLYSRRTRDDYSNTVLTEPAYPQNRVRAMTTYAWTGGLRRWYYDPSEARYNATNRFRSEAIAVSTNLAELYATRKELVKTVEKRIEQIANAYLALRRGNFVQCCRTLGTAIKRPKSNRATQAWLEYNYAWVPIVKDVYSLLNVNFKEPYRIIHGRARVGGREQSDSAKNIMFQWEGYIDWESRVAIRSKVVANGSALGPVSEFGVTNPALLAWELLPFSFVVDWFLPIGPYVERLLTPTSNLSFSDFSTTTISRSVWTGRTFVYDPKLYPAYEQTTSTGGSFSMVTEVKSRELVIPPLEFPRLKNPLSTTHFANAMSLLVEAFRGKH